jgi:hypothetical protein
VAIPKSKDSIQSEQTEEDKFIDYNNNGEIKMMINADHMQIEMSEDQV